MPTRPDVCTLNTVSNWSQLVFVMDSVPFDCVNVRAAPLRRSVTPVTWYPLSRICSTLLLGLSMTWMYSVFGLLRLTVVAPCAPFGQNPPGMPPNMNPPPSQPMRDCEILYR